MFKTLLITFLEWVFTKNEFKVRNGGFGLGVRLPWVVGGSLVFSWYYHWYSWYKK